MENVEIIQKQIRWCMIISSAVFALSIFFGYWLTIKDFEKVTDVLSQTLSQFAPIKNLNVLMIFLFIFLNNAIKGFFIIVTGTAFAIAPILFIFLNGELIGFVLGIAYLSSAGIDKALIAIAPHGILEVPALILSAGYGIWLGYKFYRFAVKSESFKIYFSYALKRYFQVILPMLFVAALIETFITPYLIRIFR